MKCPNCGADIPDDSKFCTACGEALEAKPVEEPKEPQCPNCGVKVAADAQFCTACGTKLTATEATPGQQSLAAAVTATIIEPAATDKTAVLDSDSAQTATIIDTPADAPDQAAQKVAAASTAAFATSSSSGSRPGSQGLGQTTPIPQPKTIVDQGSAPTPSPKRSKAPIIIGAVAAAVVVAAVCVGFAMASNNNTGTVQPVETPAVTETAPESGTHDWATGSVGSTESNAGTDTTPPASSSSSTSKSSSSAVTPAPAPTPAPEPEPAPEPTPTPAPSTSKTFTLHGSGETWTEARDYCEAHGGQLACIETPEDYAQILDLLNDSNYIAVFVGGFYDFEYHEWHWVDGSFFDYTAWAPGEPNNETGDEYYLSLLKAVDGWGWYDDPNNISDSYNPAKIGFVMQS